MILSYAGALVAAGMAARSLFEGGAAAAFVSIAIALTLVSLALQYVFLAFWNPLRLFKRGGNENARSQVTRSPWAG